jgi:hypothetical protein
MSQFYKAKSDFAHRENTGLYASDYLTNKKNNLAACRLKKSIYCKKKMTQGDYLALNDVIFSQSSNYVVGGTKNMLQNTFYRLDLSGIPVIAQVGQQTSVNHINISSPTDINFCYVPFYAYYVIDPDNVYGNSCDIITNN